MKNYKEIKIANTLNSQIVLPVHEYVGSNKDIKLSEFDVILVAIEEMLLTKFNINHHSGRGNSTTRGSQRNSPRYLRNAEGVAASGVPRFVIKTPSFSELAWL